MSANQSIIKNIKTIINKRPNTNLNSSTFNNTSSNPDSEIINLSSNTTSSSSRAPEVNIPSNDWIYSPDSIEGGFGGNQGSLIYNAEYLDDYHVEKIIHEYYPDATKEDFEYLMYHMNQTGCTYIAVLNTLFLEYAFHDEYDFRSRFGFNPYELVRGEDGSLKKKFNYEYLFLDYYLYYAKKLYGINNIEDVYGNTPEIMDGKGKDLALSDEEVKKTGLNPTGNYLGTDISILKTYLAEKGIIMNGGPLEIEMHSDEWYKAKEYYESTGMKVTDNQKLCYSQGFPPTEEYINDIMRSGKQLLVSAKDYNMYYPYDKDGNGKLDDIARENVGGHGMAVVPAKPIDGKIVVSSWGKEYLINISDIGNYQFVEYVEFTNDYENIYNKYSSM